MARDGGRAAAAKITSIALYTKKDVQCDKLATGRLFMALTTGSGKIFSKSRVWERVPEERIPLFCWYSIIYLKHSID